ncbi:hypothetical protein ACFPOI_53845 [Nonomuraea angiospora]|uniref:Transposase n=1 Tax=Nonomuraea angiospora TaxID=46172 RepID=A0ABR9M839_9ACTN|nr:hypothetical protein [Nonomuraea angiospora]MBE1588491.1 hypothetical protein [Nonomuraea angiospora]
MAAHEERARFDHLARLGRDLRRYCGWVFTWRPWWARLWRRDKWVVAHAENAAAIIVAEVNA